jgi:hypothetical protein
MDAERFDTAVSARSFGRSNVFGKPQTASTRVTLCAESPECRNGTLFAITKRAPVDHYLVARLELSICDATSNTEPLVGMLMPR